ncbi:MAG: hypothetical protein CSB55_04980 [Candidatus Cloacimonadota bacterium]|nr:MAG: hypothetical protein CSB55_04980 [Candidatus Cloacimonadota bacterium]
MKKIFLVILVFAFTLVSAENTGKIKGFVADECENPISGAKVILNDKIIITDSKGNFDLENLPYGIYELKIIKECYEEKKTKINLDSEDKSVNVILRPALSRLCEISVTACKTAKFTKDIPVKVDIVPLEDIENTNSLSVDEVLEYVPGLEVEENGYSRGTVKLQGLPTEYTLVLVDGERTKGGHQGTDVSQIPLDTAERIEIIKGPASALYGSDALGGVINIITKDAPESPTYESALTISTFNTTNVKANLGYGIGKFGLIANAGKYKTDGKILSEAYRADNYFAKLTYKNLNKYSFSYNMYEEKRNLFLMEERKYDYKLHSEINNFDGMQLRANAYFIEYTREMKAASDPTKAVENEWRGSIQAEKYFDNEHGLIVGTEITLRDYDSNIIKGDEDIESIYAQYEIPFWEKYTVTLGGRFDYHNDWGLQPAPKLSLLCNFTEDFLVRGSIGRGFRAPSLAELHSFWYHQPGGGLWIQGNPNLDPEHSIGVNINTEFKYLNMNNSFSVFYNDVKDMIVQEEVGTYDDDGHPLYTYFNRAKVRTYGLEYQNKYYFGKYFNTSLGYTYLHTEDEDINKELTNSPNHKILAGITYTDEKLFSEDFGFSTGIKVNWRSKIYLDWLNESEAVDRFLLDYNASLKAYKRINVIFSVKNLFDKEYEEMIVMPGRTVATTISVKF